MLNDVERWGDENIENEICCLSCLLWCTQLYPRGRLHPWSLLLLLLLLLPGMLMRSCDIIDAVCDWLATLVDRIYDAFALPGVAVVAYITACIIRLSILMLAQRSRLVLASTTFQSIVNAKTNRNSSSTGRTSVFSHLSCHVVVCIKTRSLDAVFRPISLASGDISAINKLLFLLDGYSMAATGKTKALWSVAFAEAVRVIWQIFSHFCRAWALARRYPLQDADTQIDA